MVTLLGNIRKEKKTQKICFTIEKISLWIHCLSAKAVSPLVSFQTQLKVFILLIEKENISNMAFLALNLKDVFKTH